MWIAGLSYKILLTHQGRRQNDGSTESGHSPTVLAGRDSGRMLVDGDVGEMRAWFELVRAALCHGFMFSLLKPKATVKLGGLLGYIGRDLASTAAVDANSLLKHVLLAYLCDVENYRLFGETMTGATWIHGPEGPYPKELPYALQWLGNRGASINPREAR